MSICEMIAWNSDAYIESTFDCEGKSSIEIVDIDESCAPWAGTQS